MPEYWGYAGTYECSKYLLQEKFEYTKGNKRKMSTEKGQLIQLLSEKDKINWVTEDFKEN